MGPHATLAPKRSEKRRRNGLGVWQLGRKNTNPREPNSLKGHGAKTIEHGANPAIAVAGNPLFATQRGDCETQCSKRLVEHASSELQVS